MPGARYGMDAPYGFGFVGLVVLGFWVTGLVMAVTADLAAALPALVSGTLLAGCLALSLHATLRGKFLVWRDVLDELDLRGDERLLDLGCGRGAVLLAAARHLPQGRAVGVDLWRGRDQSGNTPAATLRNARAEGVADRVHVQGGDLRRLPYAEASFDLVVSSLTVHTIFGANARAQAIAEAYRVLRPGGRLLIADLARTPREYAAVLARLNAQDIRVRGLGWRAWWGSPWVPTRLLTARKPATP
ncbi:class I SAM-dependent methyltransferase [Spirillospora sp. NPDC048819]|uniref:class I SAM-dependent methyltransferase n=1 Tax=Spirillospora sp. NPDC048819 TaxID=3155268 RepID=UPI0033E8B3AF